MGEQNNTLQFFITTPHTCNYLEDREAISLFADPLFSKDTLLYSKLLENGFRRSGEHIYKPCCNQCSECISIRIPVHEFTMNRNQKRTWKKNQDLTVTELDAGFNEEHFALYKKYIATRHSNGGMDNPTNDNYQDFLWASWSETLLFEFRLDDQLIAVAAVDRLQQALSAVYTFFNPDYSNRSPGKYAILYLIKHAQLTGLKWLYLGYWIAACDKMKYKAEYQPAECFINNNWKKFLPISPNDFAGRQN